MRSVFLLFVFFSASLALRAQTAPPIPATCNAPFGTCSLTIIGSTAFQLNDLTDFTSSESLSTITINVKSSRAYRVYIAGELIGMTESARNTIIPIGTFTVSASAQDAGGPAAPFQLAGNSVYQLLIQNTALKGPSLTAGRDHVLTINRNALSTFTQAPGNHNLYLHFYLCQY
jgi:hypothetical protein